MSCRVSDAVGRARDEAAVAHHDHFVGDALDLVQLVRDVDEGHAFGLELRHQREQALRFAGGQRRGGLVHDQQARLACQRLGDFHQLLFRDDQLAHARIGTGLQPDLAQHVAAVTARIASSSSIQPRVFS